MQTSNLTGFNQRKCDPVPYDKVSEDAKPRLKKESFVDPLRAQQKVEPKVGRIDLNTGLPKERTEEGEAGY